MMAKERARDFLGLRRARLKIGIMASRPRPRASRQRSSSRQVRDAGCTHVQGHYFGRPMPFDEVMQALSRRRAAIRKPGYA
jgi:hypothetical protein